MLAAFQQCIVTVIINIEIYFVICIIFTVHLHLALHIFSVGQPLLLLLGIERLLLVSALLRALWSSDLPVDEQHCPP